jgi:PAS domain S-box-containing protein
MDEQMFKMTFLPQFAHKPRLIAQDWWDALPMNPETRMAARTLLLINLAILTSYLLFLLLMVLIQDWMPFRLLLAAIALQAGTISLILRGRVKLAGMLMNLIALAFVTAIGTFGYGIHDIAIFGYQVVIIVSAFAMRRRPAIILLLLVMLSISWLAFGEMLGLIPHRLPGAATPTDWAVLMLVEGISAMGVTIMTSNLRQSLALATVEIAEREKAEKVLHESAARYRGLFENAPVGIALAALDGRILVLNPAAHRIVDPDGTQDSMDVNILTDPQQRAAGYAAAFERCAAVGTLQTVRGWYTPYAGRNLYLDVQLAPVRDAAGRLVQIQAIIHDLTGQKLDEQKLNDSRELYQILFEQSGDTVMLLDARPGGIPVILEVNEAAVRAYGYTREEMVGQPISIVDPQPPLEIAERMANGAPGMRVNFNAVHRRKDGSVFHVGVEAMAVEQDGRLLAISVEHDITESQQNARVLEAAARMSAGLRRAVRTGELLRTAGDEMLALVRPASLALLLNDGNGGRQLRAVYARGSWTALGGAAVSLASSPQAWELCRAAAEQRQTFMHRMESDPFLPESAWDRPQVFGVTPLAASGADVGFICTLRETGLTGFEIRLLTAVAEIAANAVQRALLHEQTERRMLQVQALRAIDTAIAASTDIRTVMGVALTQVVTHMQADSACVYRYLPAAQQFTLLAVQGSYPPEADSSADESASGSASAVPADWLAGRVVRENRLVELLDLTSPAARGRQPAELLRSGYQAYIGVPLEVRGEINGVLEVFYRAPQEENRDRGAFLAALAQQTAIAIDAKTLFANLQSANLQLLAAYDSSIFSIAQALDLRDHETEGHSRRVAAGAETLARAMGMAEADLVHLRRGALLHDFGKLAVPDPILLKTGPLTGEEWVQMRQHPVYAYEILKQVAYLAPALNIPHYHHERWDGSGYPEGLRGEQIPAMARIFAVIDVWDALTMDRPYRPAWSWERTRAYIAEQSGWIFDPRVVAVFLSLPDFRASQQPAQTETSA